MKKIILLSFILGCFFTLGRSQDIETGNYYVILKVKYQVKKEGIVYDMMIDLGSDKSHPLNGVLSNSDKGILVKESGRQIVLSNEVDILSYLKTQGWIIDHCFEIKMLGVPWVNYILKEQNRQ